MSHLRAAHAHLLAQLPQVRDANTDEYPRAITTSVDLNSGGHLWFTVFDGDRLEVKIEGVPTISDYEGEGEINDSTILRKLKAAMAVLAKLPPNDEWDSRAEYGYADANVLGTETWEDQKQLEAIKRKKGIPDHWVLTKCRDFDGRKLQEMAEWLKDNCTNDFKRVGWSSGCSTTVGIAFQSSTDAFFYRLRWR